MRKITACLVALIVFASFCTFISCDLLENAKTYTVVLDYDGALVSGERQLDVVYGKSLPELPLNLSKDHYVFKGWFTEANCKGVKVCDEYGLIPVVSKVTEENFDLSSEIIYLYAGFELEKLQVTLCYGNLAENEIVNVEYGSSVRNINASTRIEGKAVLSWSLKESGDVFNGSITAPTTLYALEYAPIIEFDSNGGNDVKSIISREGEPINLPTPQRENYMFLNWINSSGNKVDFSEMPTNSQLLKAVWKAKIVFDENGGSNVEDVCVNTGEKINLPTTKKDGYVFAGWYTENREKYSATEMPSEGIKLKAGWYQQKQERIVVVGDSKVGPYEDEKISMRSELCLDMSSVLPNDYDGEVTIDAHLKMGGSGWSWIKKFDIYLYFYTENQVVSYALLGYKRYEVQHTDYWQVFTYLFTANIKGNKIYGAIYADSNGRVDIKDYYFTVTYTDTSELFL